MAKYYLILAVIISAIGLSVGVKAESSAKAESGKLINMQFTVDENNNGIPDDEEEDVDSKAALGE